MIGETYQRRCTSKASSFSRNQELYVTWNSIFGNTCTGHQFFVSPNEIITTYIYNYKLFIYLPDSIHVWHNSLHAYTSMNKLKSEADLKHLCIISIHTHKHFHSHSYLVDSHPCFIIIDTAQNKIYTTALLARTKPLILQTRREGLKALHCSYVHCETLRKENRNRIKIYYRDNKFIRE